MAETREITWDPEADRRIKRSPFLMRRFIRKRIEDRVASRGRTHVTEADVDESASMYRQYRFKLGRFANRPKNIRAGKPLFWRTTTDPVRGPVGTRGWLLAS
jgi:hypothetical protein